MIHQLIDILESDDRISGWQVRELHKRSTQLFINKEREEGRRSVESLVYEVEILVTRKVAVPDSKNKRWVTGNARALVAPGALGRFKSDLETLLASANLVFNQKYQMTEVQGVVPRVELADPALWADPEGVLEQGLVQVRQAAERERGVRLVAAEFFGDRLRTRYFNSQGVNCLFESTLLSGEFCLLAQAPQGESEVFRAFKRRRLADLGLENLLAQAAEQSRRRLDAGLPKSGAFDVVFSGEALDHFFAWCLTQASAAAYYNKMTAAEIGQKLVEAAPGATKLNLYSNALLPWGVGSYKVDSSGTLGCRRKLIEDGVLVGRQADARYAQYLGITASGEWGNVEVSPGAEPAADLLKPGERPLYHLSDFSYFEPNGVTGEFSSEIRFGEERSSGGVRAVKGGSVSGLTQAALRTARFSAETEMRERYMGPTHIRLENLTLAGD
jgi:predicted Zn-dependent protease